MNDLDDEKLEKVVVDLPNHWAEVGAEGMWAKALGNDEYELRNTPFYAYGLNWGDIVLAVSPSPDLKPVVSKVTRPSGNRTLRVIFADAVDRERQVELLEGLSKLGLSYERATGILVALDIAAETDIDLVVDAVSRLENQRLLEFETCEARAEGRFDDGPEPEEDIVGEYEN